jgi:hypothetical protein
LGK